MSNAGTRTSVSRVADWAGWCSPCERDDRPLVLTRSGRLGVASWLAGVSDEDRILLLTCRVCGSWQYVPLHEEDDPEVVLAEEDVLEAVAEIVHAGRVEAPVELVEPVRAALPGPDPTSEPTSEIVAAVPTSIQRDLPTAPPREMAHDTRATAAPLELDVVVPPPLLLPVPRDEVSGEVSGEVVVPAPRAETPVKRIVTVPERESVTAPAFSPEAVAAAAAVLSAARRQSETPGTRERRSGAAAAAAAPAPAPAAELPAVLGLPVGTRQLVLAVAG